MEKEQVKENVQSASIWIRLIYMLLFVFATYLSMMVFWFVVVVQFLFALITGQPNPHIAKFSDVLCQYIAQCLGFLSFGTEEKPFPFDDFPESRLDDGLEDQSDIDAHS